MKQLIHGKIKIRRPPVLIGVVGMMLVAGCAGSPVEEAKKRPMESEIPLAATTASLGAVDGLVIDEALLPVPNATLAILPKANSDQPLAEAITDEGGRFVFSLVEPATYRLRASAPGFAAAVQLVEVRPGEVTGTRIVLPNTPSRASYIAVSVKSGLLSCAAAAILVPTTRNCDGAERYRLRFGIPEAWSATILEGIWPSRSEALSQWIYKNVTGVGGTSAGSLVLIHQVWSKSPLRGALLPGAQYRSATESQVPTGGFQMNVLGYYAGILMDEINQTAAPACRQNVYQRCVGVGFTPELRYTIYASIFVNGRPDDLTIYSALPDA